MLPKLDDAVIIVVYMFGYVGFARTSQAPCAGFNSTRVDSDEQLFSISWCVRCSCDACVVLCVCMFMCLCVCVFVPLRVCVCVFLIDALSPR